MAERTPLPAQGSVSAAEHERLRRDYAALKGQFDAADEVLTAVFALLERQRRASG